MKVVFKYEVSPASDFTHAMPAGFDVLSVHMQRGRPVFWALVDPDAPKFPRRFHVIPTGHPFVPGRWRYLGTFQDPDESLVFHVFLEEAS